MKLRLAAAGTIAFLVTATPAIAGKAVLEVVETSPFTVRGVGFAPGERVTVVAQVRGRHVKRLTAGKTGAFTIRFDDISVSDCPAYIVRATGKRGSRAYLRSLTECNPAGPPP